MPKLMILAKHGGQPAVTRWEVVQRYRQVTLLRCFPQTGRTHQIRVHLQSIGLPLAVDPLYNRSRAGLDKAIFLSQFKQDYKAKREQDERPLIARLTLHAARISFHDLANNPVTVECPLPKDFRATLNMLGKYSRY
jgi:23S rRNA-/tRNA-specific pseudouridylate synthase